MIEAATRLGSYYANTAEYRAWTRLVLRTDTQSEILVSFHGAGREYRGLLAVSVCFFGREVTEDGERQVAGLTPVCEEIFQVNYREERSVAESRFRGGSTMR
jgi:hypothetical protein